jgi:hypothetical protein
MIKTWAPIFPGLYATWYEFDVSEEEAVDSLFWHKSEPEQLLLGELVKRRYPDAVDEDYEGYCNDVAKAVCRYLSWKLKDILGIEMKVELQRIVSPQYYNFKNDSLDIQIDVDEDLLISKVREIIDKNLDEFKKYIKDNYTSCDGFMSFYSNDVNDWLKSSYNAHEIGSLLEFILRISEDDIAEDMYYSVSEEINKNNYLSVSDALANVLEEPEVKEIFKEYERLDNQTKAYKEYMREKGKKIDYDGLRKQYEKNTNELCSEIIKLMEGK